VSGATEQVRGRASYHWSLRLRSPFFRAPAVVFAITALVSAADVATQRGPASYTLIAPDGRKVSLPFRTAGGADLVPLEQLATLFGFTLAEDTLVGGLTMRGGGQTILLIPGQAAASIGPGRLVSLPAPVQEDRGTWHVPVDFIRLALAPALGLRAEVRRASRLVLVGDVRLPEITGTLERTGGNGRLVFEIQPGAPNRVTREGNRLVMRVDAVGVELGAVTGLTPELVSAVRADGAAVIVELGPAVTGYRVETPDAEHVAIDLAVAGAPPPTAARPAPADPPIPDLGGGPATVRSIVLDPGHGGADAGVSGADGTREKDYVLDLARRIKSAIETRLGLRVLLTREGDDAVPFDRRMSLANNNKADLFVSLHANASINADTGGAQVLSLNGALYQGRPEAVRTPDLPVPVVTGGSRTIDLVPWDLAQIPFSDESARVAAVLARRLGERRVRLYTPPTGALPLRPLVGANMPAVLLEVGFLTNPADEDALTGDAVSTAIVEAVVDMIGEVRRGGAPLAPDAGQ
jgi:N-acetylmuramoyl-L-alanine amidase